MIDKTSLPDGITYNQTIDDKINLELKYESINNSKCQSCGITFEAVLITNFGRHEGMIRTYPNENTVWKNSLPKDLVRSIKLLNENLVTKLDKHMERHNND